MIEVERISVSSTNPEAYLAVCAENDGKKKPAVLIYPGGAYRYLSEGERFPVADYFEKKGFRPFILMYSVGEKAHYPDPLIEGSRAVWEIRRNAAKYGVNPDQITLVGFSAGAHAAMMLATLWQDDASRFGTDIPYGGNRPNATVTGYTPTTFEDFFDKPENAVASQDGMGPEIVLGKEGTRWADYRSLTVHNFVTELAPPAFLWKTSSDYPGFSTKYAQACKEHGVECELHIFSDRNRCVAMEFDPERAMKYRPEISQNTQLWRELAVNWLHDIYNDR